MRYWLFAIVPLFLFFALFLSNRNAPAKAPETSHKIGDLVNTSFVGKSTNLNKVFVLPNGDITNPTNVKGMELSNKLISQKESPIISLDPLPDDEVLTYGVDILNSLRAHRQVKVVLFSNSVSSDSFYEINGRNDQGQKVYDSYLHKYNNPIKEKYQQGYLTRTEFGAARVREYQQACLALGLKPSDIYFVNLENGFNPKEISHVIQTFLKEYPNAEFRTMTKEDVHPEHAMLGRVLQSFVDRHIIEPSKVRYLVSINTLIKPSGNGSILPLRKKKERKISTILVKGSTCN